MGYGELGCYGGGIVRGADTKRIDAFVTQGMKLLNFAPEAQCTPSRSVLMTGRYAIRSGNHTVAQPGDDGGLVAWKGRWATLYLSRTTPLLAWANGILELPPAAGQPRFEEVRCE